MASFFSVEMISSSSCASLSFGIDSPLNFASCLFASNAVPRCCLRGSLSLSARSFFCLRLLSYVTYRLCVLLFFSPLLLIFFYLSEEGGGFGRADFQSASEASGGLTIRSLVDFSRSCVLSSVGPSVRRSFPLGEPEHREIEEFIRILIVTTSSPASDVGGMAAPNYLFSESQSGGGSVGRRPYMRPSEQHPMDHHPES